MLSQLTIPKKKTVTAIDEATAPLDHEQLFAIGLGYVQKMSSRLWNDYNVHDPGITSLELLAYALTDLSYRASLPIEDLLASAVDNESEMKEQFFTARQIFPNRALTLADYRKLLIDVVGVKNAWLRPSPLKYYADTIHGMLLRTPPAGAPGIIDVDVRGLYDVLIEYDDDRDTPTKQLNVRNAVRDVLHANRNLCEDFLPATGVPTQHFVLCTELELKPDADITEVHAQILFQVDEYLSPSVHQYTLAEMLATTRADGTPYAAETIFEGPVLTHGFIPDEELEASDLRTEIRLSDIMSIIMDVEGVQAIRDISFNPAGMTTALANKWVIPVTPGSQALLDRTNWRLVSYKREMPFTPDKTTVGLRWLDLETSLVAGPNSDDFDIPLGRFRTLDAYYSVQNHFPAVYGIGEQGLAGGANAARQAQARQLKGYLLFFDQIMANYFAQLSHVRDLFSLDPALERTYFYQVVNSFNDYQSIYGVSPGSVVATIEADAEDPAVLIERRNRFLDHLIARFAERFTDFANVMYAEFGASPSAMIDYKCAFLASYPATSSARSMAYNYRLNGTGDLWGSGNVSGLERRLAGLLGIADPTRRNIDGPTDEGMFLIENILLRPDPPPNTTDPFLPICPDPNCVVCADEDPYTYRLHMVLPAYGPRFGDIDFRRWAERLIRSEVPAHIQPKICWISQAEMVDFQNAYMVWLNIRAGLPPATTRTADLTTMITELYTIRNVYPQQSLNECTDPESEPRFILGRSALGTM